MSEDLGNLQPHLDRTSEEYIGSAEENSYCGLTFGVYGGETPPVTFEELLEAVESKDCDCDMSTIIGGILVFISSLPNRDEIVSLLPYEPTTKHVLLALPESDLLKQGLIVDVQVKRIA